MFTTISLLVIWRASVNRESDASRAARQLGRRRCAVRFAALPRRRPLRALGLTEIAGRRPVRLTYARRAWPVTTFHSVESDEVAHMRSRTAALFAIGSLAVMACAGRQSVATSAPWPPSIPSSVLRQVDAVIDHELAHALTCRLSDVPLDLAGHKPFYMCEAGDSAGPGPSAMAVLDVTAQPLEVAQTWRATEAEEPGIWAKMIAANNARWGVALSCPGHEAIWLTSVWHIEARLDRFVQPLNGRAYQVSYVAWQRSPLKPRVSCRKASSPG